MAASPFRVPAPPRSLSLRQAFDRWTEAEQRSKDSIASCGRAVALFEQVVGKDGLHGLTRSQGDAFGAWLLKQPTTTTTARDRLNWVKVLLKYAAQDLEVIPKSRARAHRESPREPHR